MKHARITRKHIGRACTFAGYDGISYPATIVRVARGIVAIHYRPKGFTFAPEPATAYVEQTDRRLIL